MESILFRKPFLLPYIFFQQFQSHWLKMTLKSLNSLELIFVRVVDMCLISFFHMWASCFPSIFCLNALFLQVYNTGIFSKCLMALIMWINIWVSMPAFVLGPCCFYYSNAVIKLGISRGNPPFFLLLRVALAIWDLWCFTVNFKIFFYFHEECREYFDWNYIEFSWNLQIA